MIESQHYSHGTRLDREPCPGGWRYVAGRVMCSDNRVRALYRVALYPTPAPDTENDQLLSATVRVRGKNVMGHVIMAADASGPLKFRASPAGINGKLLTAP